MRHLKRIASLLMILLIIISVASAGTTGVSANGTGTGLAEWALNAYYSGWSYVYGGATPGAVDCSGLIYSYAGGYRTDFEPYADYIGYVSNGIPNIHGLVLSTPSHYGVYVGNGMAVDARGSDYGVIYESAYGRRWDMYLKVPGVSYPTTGWEQFNGQYFYYEDGEYITDTSRTFDGVTYYFDSSGASDKTPGDTGATADTQESESAAYEEVTSSSDISYETSEQTTDAPQETDPPEEEEEITYKPGDTGDEIAVIQQRLKDLKYYKGNIDGIFGDATQEALIKFQTNNGLFGTGTADPFSVIVLNLEDATEASEEPEATQPESRETEPPKTEPSVSTSAPLTVGIAEVSTELTSEIILQTANFSAKALANLTSGAEITSLRAPSDNSDFMRWFFVILATMGISFAIALSIEKINEKRAKARKKARQYKATHIKK